MKRLTLSVILLSLSVMACGMSVPTESPESVNKTVLMNTPEFTPAPVPVNVPEKATTCGRWNIRAAANPNSASIGFAFSGSTVTLTGRTATAFDGGLWVQVLDMYGDTGWMNAKGLCHD